MLARVRAGRRQETEGGQQKITKCAEGEARREKLQLPELQLPELQLPELQLPELQLPELQLPELQLPELQLPELQLPELQLPELQLPELQLPELQLPELQLPELQLPELQLPELKLGSQPASQPGRATPRCGDGCSGLGRRKDDNMKEKVLQAPHAADVAKMD